MAKGKLCECTSDVMYRIFFYNETYVMQSKKYRFYALQIKTNQRNVVYFIANEMLPETCNMKNNLQIIEYLMCNVI